MTPKQANSIGLACAAISLAFAIHLAGLFGVSQASSGSGFYSFLIYIVVLLLGFLLPSQFSPTQKEAVKTSTWAGAKIAIPMTAIWLLLQTGWGETFLVKFVAPIVPYGWFLPPICLAGFSAVKVFSQEDQYDN